MSLADEMAQTTKNALEVLEEMRKLREENERASYLEKQAKQHIENEKACPTEVERILKQIEAEALKGQSSLCTSRLWNNELDAMVEQVIIAKGFKIEHYTDTDYESVSGESSVMERVDTHKARISWSL